MSVSVHFEVELDDDAALRPSRNVEELRANGRWLRDLLAPARTAIGATPHLRLVSWSSSAALADAQE